MTTLLVLGYNELSFRKTGGVPTMLSADFVTSYFDAWNQHDAGGVAEHLAQEGIYFDIPIQQQLTRDGLIAHLDGFFLRDTSVYRLMGEVLTADDSIAFQYIASPIDSDAEEDSWTGAEFISMVGNAAGKIEDYYQTPNQEVPNQPTNGSARGVAVQRYAKSGLGANALQSVMQDLTVLMNNERVYLESDLTLPQLAAQLDCSVNHLSQAINAGFGVGFFDLINQYRIQAAKGMLCQNAVGAPAILNIALTVGFNSTSTFYAAFKKTTGQTPAQYRRAQITVSSA